MALFAKALRCLYQDKDAVYLWPEGFAACAAVCAESRASLDGVSDMIGRFDLDICQCAMIVNSCTGEKFFRFGPGARDAIAQRHASALFVNSYRLPARIQKYEGRGFAFDAAWESKWRAWLATQPPAPTAGEIATRDVETHPAFVSLRRFWTTGEYEQPAELCNDKSTLYRYVWKL